MSGTLSFSRLTRELVPFFNVLDHITLAEA